MYWFEVSFERILADWLLYKQRMYKVMEELQVREASDESQRY